MISKQFQNILHTVPSLNNSQLTKLHHDVGSYMTNNQEGQTITEHVPYDFSSEIMAYSMFLTHNISCYVD
jgi:hypothetical protein